MCRLNHALKRLSSNQFDAPLDLDNMSDVVKRTVLHTLTDDITSTAERSPLDEDDVQYVSTEARLSARAPAAKLREQERDLIDLVSPDVIDLVTPDEFRQEKAGCKKGSSSFPLLTNEQRSSIERRERGGIGGSSEQYREPKADAYVFDTVTDGATPKLLPPHAFERPAQSSQSAANSSGGAAASRYSPQLPVESLHMDDYSPPAFPLMTSEEIRSIERGYQGNQSSASDDKSVASHSTIQRVKVTVGDPMPAGAALADWQLRPDAVSSPSTASPRTDSLLQQQQKQQQQQQLQQQKQQEQQQQEQQQNQRKSPDGAHQLMDVDDDAVRQHELFASEHRDLLYASGLNADFSDAEMQYVFDKKGSSLTVDQFIHILRCTRGKY